MSSLCASLILSAPAWRSGRVLVCETSGRGFEPHSARVSQTHFKLNILSADIIEYITVKLSIAVKLLQLTLL